MIAARQILHAGLDPSDGLGRWQSLLILGLVMAVSVPLTCRAAHWAMGRRLDRGAVVPALATRPADGRQTLETEV